MPTQTNIERHTGAPQETRGQENTQNTGNAEIIILNGLIGIFLF